MADRKAELEEKRKKLEEVRKSRELKKEEITDKDGSYARLPATTTAHGGPICTKMASGNTFYNWGGGALTHCQT